jgi:hypothetical protein
MKVRWMHQTLRLRITPGELAALGRGEPVTEASGLPGGWSATLAPGPETTLTSTAPASLMLSLSATDLLKLQAPDAEGVYLKDGPLDYYVEKDFPCLHPRPTETRETATETFAPPEGFADRK